jgi:hypothetical protein
MNVWPKLCHRGAAVKCLPVATFDSRTKVSPDSPRYFPKLFKYFPLLPIFVSMQQASHI